MNSWISFLCALPRRWAHLRDGKDLGIFQTREIPYDVGPQ